MADIFDFWTHGVAVVPQHTPHLSGDENGLFMMPLSWGTVVQQDHGTHNWFHIPLPGATQLDDWPAHPRRAWLRVKIGDHAEITKINVYSVGSGEEWDAVPLNPETDYGLRGREEELTINLYEGVPVRPPRIDPAKGPMVMSIRADFDGDGPAEERQILFAGAGLSYVET